MKHLVFAGLAALALAGCATAVSDSLARRGVTAKDVAIERLGAANATAARLRDALTLSSEAVSSIPVETGALIGQKIAAADAACANAARESQTLRIETRSAYEAIDRWIGEQSAEFAYRGAGLSNGSEWRTRVSRLATDFDRAGAAANRAIVACSAEAEFLKLNPTIGAALSRGAESAMLGVAAADAARFLNLARIEADSLASAIEGD